MRTPFEWKDVSVSDQSYIFLGVDTEQNLISTVLKVLYTCKLYKPGYYPLPSQSNLSTYSTAVLHLSKTALFWSKFTLHTRNYVLDSLSNKRVQNELKLYSSLSRASRKYYTLRIFYTPWPWAGYSRVWIKKSKHWLWTSWMWYLQSLLQMKVFPHIPESP